MKTTLIALLALGVGLSLAGAEKKKADNPKAESPGFVAAKKAYGAGKYKEVIKLLEVELAAEKKKAKPDETRVGKILNGLAASYNNIGLAHGKKGEYDKALEFYQKSLDIKLVKLGKDHPSVALTYYNIGVVHDDKAEYDKALEYHRKSLAINLKKLGPDHLDVAQSYHNIGLVHSKKGEYDKALEYHKKALAIWLKKLGPEHPDVATIYNNIGAVHDKKSEYDKALENFQKSLAINLKQLGPDHPNVADSYNNIGAVHYNNKGENDKALEYYQKALAIDLKTKGADHLDVAISYNNIGLAHGKKDEHDKALEYHQKALAIRLKQLGPDHLKVATIYNEIGAVHNEKAEYDKALEYHRKSLAINLKKLGPDHLDVAQSYHNIGLVHSKKGEYDKALENYQKSLAIRLKQLGPEHPDVATSYNNIGAVHDKKSEYDKALEYHQKALAINLKQLGPDHPNVADSYNNIGAVHYNNKGENDKALEYYQKALAIDLKTKGADHLDVAISYSNIGLAHHNNKGENDKALEYHKKALAIWLKKLGPEHPNVASSYNSIGFAQHSLKNPVAALAAARKAQAIYDKRLAYMLSFTSERERLAYQRTQSPYNLLGSLGSAPDLAKAVLHNKGIVLSSILEDQLAAQASSDPKMKELLSQLRTASRQLNKLEMENPRDTSEAGWKSHRGKREAARDKARKLQQALARNVGGFGQARALLSLTAKNVQGGLSEDAVLLEFISYWHNKDQGEKRYGAIILPKTGEPKWVPMGSAEAIGKLLAQCSPLKPASDEAYEKVLRGLYDKLMAPVVKQLPKGTKTLILSPDGNLNFLSFATLLTEKDRFLCENYTIKYVSTGRDLVPGKQINQPKGDLLVFANPTYDEVPVQLASANGVALTLRSLDRDELRGGLKFKALPGTQKEADYLRGKAKDWMLKPKVYTGKTATEAAISGIQSPRILHLATHGFFLPEEKAKDEPRSKRLMVGLGNEQQKYRGPIRNPMHRSGLALAGAQKTLDAWAKGETPPTENDGILTAAEVSVLNLKGTWLVTLSACETGRGEARSGEGVLGLRRAFIQAGAQNLLMTLWPVSDKYTVPFMKDFYERAIASKDAPTTLAEVQKEMLLEFRKKYGTKLAVQLYGPFIMSFQGVE